MGVGLGVAMSVSVGESVGASIRVCACVQGFREILIDTLSTKISTPQRPIFGDFDHPTHPPQQKVTPALAGEGGGWGNESPGVRVTTGHKPHAVLLHRV